jgi:uncharacterized Zn finger protein
MPSRPCPICTTETVRLLDVASEDAYVNYYRCLNCGHVWTVPKSNPDGPIHHVTKPTKPADESKK